jgi:hypothetical protein
VSGVLERGRNNIVYTIVIEREKWKDTEKGVEINVEKRRAEI